MTNPESSTIRKLPRRAWVIAAVLLICGLCIAVTVSILDAIRGRYLPNQIMTARTLNAANHGDEVVILVGINRDYEVATGIEGVLLEPKPDSTYQRTTQPIEAFYDAGMVQVRGGLGKLGPGDVIQVEGAIYALQPHIIINAWRMLVVTDQITIN